MSEKLRVPRRKVFADPMQMMIGGLVTQASSESNWAHRHPNKSLRQVMGYPLPTWQRGKEWDEAQSERFIISAYTGVHLGMFCYNETMKDEQLDGLLIDGQQRLLAIESYLADGFSVEAEDGNKYRWSELTEREHAHFLRMGFPFCVVKYHTEADLKMLYNTMAFGGTPHRPDQAAKLD